MAGPLDAPGLAEAMSRFLEALELHREEIDSLNVFPVPDGDTGTNLLLTQRAVVEALSEGDRARRTAAGPRPLSELGRVIGRAALMGARGNSGVILSQILRGFCDRYCIELDRGERPDGRHLARALARAEAEARKAVAQPVEGTILTVLRHAAEAAVRRAESSEDQGTVVAAALEAGAAALERTPEQLPELRRAGVVDAGGKGLVLLLDALAATVRGEELSVEVGPMGPVGQRPSEEAPSTDFGYEVMYLATASGPGLERLRGRLGEIGDSLVVVGGGGLYQVHVHTDDPGGAVEEGVRAARRIEAIRISSLDAAVAARCVAAEGFREVRRSEAGGQEASVDGDEPATQSVVAVAEGDGFAALFGSVGARVVRGGPGSNPSVRELADAIEAAPGEVVFLLVNHRNILPAARAAAGDSAKRVEVLPTGSMAHGLAAALAFLPDAEPEANREALIAAAEEVCHGEVARADKGTDWRGGRIEPGDWVGLSGGEVLASGEEEVPTVLELCRALDPSSQDHGELLTLYLGADTTEESGERTAAALRQAFPHLEVEVHRGDQPRYPYLLTIE